MTEFVELTDGDGLPFALNVAAVASVRTITGYSGKTRLVVRMISGDEVYPRQPYDEVKDRLYDALHRERLQDTP